VADQDVQLDACWISTGGTALAAHGRVDAMNELGDGDRIGLGERQRRLVSRDGRADHFAVTIGQRDARAQQVRAVGAAAQVRRVAARAVRFIETLAADHYVLRGDLAGELREPAATAAALTASRRAGA